MFGRLLSGAELWLVDELQSVFAIVKVFASRSARPSRSKHDLVLIPECARSVWASQDPKDGPPGRRAA